MLTLGIGNASGVIIGGLLGHILYKIDHKLPLVATGSRIVLSCVPMYFIINMEYGDGESGGVGQILNVSVAIIFTGILAIAPPPIERVILNDITLPEARGRSNSFLSVIDNTGKGFGTCLLSL